MKFTDLEKAKMFDLIFKFVGTRNLGPDKARYFEMNLQNRMKEIGCPTFNQYLAYSKKNRSEQARLINALTIHTTSWFREIRHFDYLDQYFGKGGYESIKCLSLGCSIGLEVYSIGLVLEKHRLAGRIKDYNILGCDIDQISIDKAAAAVYSRDQIKNIPREYIPKIQIGHGRAKGYITVHKDIKKRCRFKKKNALYLAGFEGGFDLIFCRNMLIYFQPDQVDAIVNSLVRLSVHEGILILGHSESVEPKTSEMQRIGGAIYKIENQNSSLELPPTLESHGKEKSSEVLLVDDSSTIRHLVKRLLGSEGIHCHAVGSAEEASEALADSNYQVILLDLNLPGADGDTWLATERANGLETPCILISESSGAQIERVMDFLQDKAEDYITKMDVHTQPGSLVEKVKAYILDGTNTHGSKVSVVIVEDSDDVLDMYTMMLEHLGCDVHGFNSVEAGQKFLMNHNPDFIVTDYMMEEMSGVDLARSLRSRGIMIPIILVSGFLSDVPSDTRKELFYDCLVKPINEQRFKILVDDFKYTKSSVFSRNLVEIGPMDFDVILLGASTGGPKTLVKLLNRNLRDLPPVVVVQHMHEDFQDAFATSLGKRAHLNVEIIEKQGTNLEHGNLYFPKKDHHIQLDYQQGELQAKCSNHAAHKGHRPAVDPLFISASNLKNIRVLAIILTGMGSDGAEGLKRLKLRGNSYNIAQDENSCVIFGMPRSAIEADAVHCIASIDEIGEYLERLNRFRRKVA